MLDMITKLKQDKDEIEKKMARVAQQVNSLLTESVRLRGELDATNKIIADLEKDHAGNVDGKTN
jgi:uncharacterized coiled-coil DUF342 family protein